MDNIPSIYDLVKRYPQLDFVKNEMEEAVQSMVAMYSKKGKALICGNGGSSSDADHMVGELMKSFEIMRPLNNSIKEKLTTLSGGKGDYLAEKLQHGIPAFSLSANSALISAISNDMGNDLVFAQQVISIGHSEDIFIGFSTSGNSQNIINAAITAKAIGIKTICFTGETGGLLKEFSDILINVPEKNTASVQELHLPIYHTICREVEKSLFNHSNQ